MKKTLCKILSVVLSLPFAIMTITSCGRNDFGIEKMAEEATEAVVEQHADEKQKSKQYKEDKDGNPVIDFEIPVATAPNGAEIVDAEKPESEQATDEGELIEKLPIQETYEEYVEDIEDTESFVYGLVTERLGLEYDVFSSYVTLSDETTRIYGIGYTRFDEAYVLEDDEKTYFGSGFISFLGEQQIPETEGYLKMTRLGETSEDYGFLYTYSMEDYKAHTVVYNEYVQYGVENKQLTYTEEKISSRAHLEKICDQSLGSLYSYDENKMLLETDFGFTPVNGISLFEDIDYKALQAEIDNILATQDVRFCKTDVETMVNVGKEALESYLLGLQEESFCGYSVAQLIEIAEGMDPMMAIRITADGLVAVEIEPQPPEPPSSFVKWMMGIAAAICVAATIVCTVVPGLQGFVPLAGGLSGMAIEAAVEVIGENKHLNELNPIKLAVAAVGGALGGAATSLIADAVIGGATNAVFTLIDGGSLLNAGISFATGTLLGVAIGGACKLVTKGVSKAIGAIKVKKLPVVADAIDDALANKLDDAAPDAVKYNASKAVKEAAEESVDAAMQKAANNISDPLTDAEIQQARNAAGKAMKDIALENIQDGTRFYGLDYDIPADREIIEFVQQNGRFPNFQMDSIQCEFAHAVDVNEVVKAYNKGLISKADALSYISDPMNGILTSHKTHFRYLHGGNWKNVTDSAFAVSKRPEIMDTVEEILRRIGK